jgi:hypothetical protein
VLRRTVRDATRWFPATIAPLALFAWLDFQRGLAPAPIVETLSRASQIGQAAISGALVGLLLGGLTGAVLMRLVEEPR